MMGKWWLLVALILFHQPQNVQPCKCLFRNSSMQFCVAEFVLLVNITKIDTEKLVLFRDTSYQMRRYTFDTLEVFKMTPSYNQTVEKNSIITAPSSAACGVTLNTGEYLVSGMVGSQRLHSNLCSWNAPWDSVSIADKHSLLNGTFPSCLDSI